MVKIIWSDRSIEDINNIAEFIAKDSTKYAKIQVQRFFDRVKILIAHPYAGRIVPEINDTTIKRINNRKLSDNLQNCIGISDRHSYCSP